MGQDGLVLYERLFWAWEICCKAEASVATTRHPDSATTRGVIATVPVDGRSRSPVYLLR